VSAALDFKRAADPAEIFIEGVRDADGNRVEPAQWQRDFIRSDARRILILVNRQGGKSTTVGAKCAHGLIYNPGLYLIIARALRQSKELLRKVRAVYSNLSDAPRIVRSTETELELSNGSLLVALPGDDDATIRGFSAPRAIYIDEASRVSDEMYAAIRPMLSASRTSQMIALTTPYGRRGWFYEQWSGGRKWERITITARECPHITEEHLEDERADMSEWQFRQEYLCEFTDTKEQFFSSDLIEAMVDSSLEYWI
jgi:phage terminase large subunit-like protein